MRFLLDTNILIWAAFDSNRLSHKVRELLVQPDVERFFSVASLWETAIKGSLKRDDFDIDVQLFRRLALQNGYQELPFLIEHLVALTVLPLHHKDPFDRMIIAQAQTEGLTLLTSDGIVAKYGGDIVHL
jgi:PIN domain nuclease of toxin-antitoxin system